MRKTALLLVGTTLLLAKVSLAETGNEKDLARRVTFNYGILQTVKDSEVFLYILNELHNGNPDNVERFIEYQLDEMVVGLSQKMDKCNAYQKIQSHAALQKIMQYRMEYPRNFEEKSNPPSVSQFLMEENSDIPIQANEILQKMKAE